MKTYTVQWEIMLDADDPEQAARNALYIMQDTNSDALYFKVIHESGKLTDVGLIGGRMNIFYLSRDPVEAAKLQCDRHVVKMILETAQLLSTAHVELDGEQVAYKATHKNHPSCGLGAV